MDNEELSIAEIQNAMLNKQTELLKKILRKE